MKEHRFNFQKQKTKKEMVTKSNPKKSSFQKLIFKTKIKMFTQEDETCSKLGENQPNFHKPNIRN